MFDFGADGIQQHNIVKELSKWWPPASARAIAERITALFESADAPARAVKRAQISTFVDGLIDAGENTLMQWRPPAKETGVQTPGITYVSTYRRVGCMLSSVEHILLARASSASPSNSYITALLVPNALVVGRDPAPQETGPRWSVARRYELNTGWKRALSDCTCSYACGKMNATAVELVQAEACKADRGSIQPARPSTRRRSAIV